MTPRDRRALLLGGAIAVAAFGGLRVGPWAWHRTRNIVDRLQARAELLERARADVRHVQGLEDSAAAIRAKVVALAPKILSGGTPPEALADLTGRLTVAAERHRVRLERTDLITDSTRSGELWRVSVRSAIESDTRGTFEFLGALVQDPTVLTVGQVRIVAPDPGSLPAAAEILRTELTVHGWYLNREHGR